MSDPRSPGPGPDAGARPTSPRAYYFDSYTTEFDAEVAEALEHAGRPALILRQTYFYPTSGGQPHDTGRIGPARVVEVVEREADGAVLHLLDRPLQAEAVTPGRLRATIDRERRYDHMQQHTAQHLLSAAFVAELGAPTVSFHLGAETSTIDIALDTLGSLTPEAAERVEERANAVVEANREVACYEVPAEAAAGLGLRKPTERTGPIRIVEVPDFDRSACGGTHVRRTGELGIIKIRRWERRGTRADVPALAAAELVTPGGSGGAATVFRVEFVAGGRARRDYRRKNETVNRLANALSIRDTDVAETVLRLIEEHRERGRELQALRNRLLDHEAAALWREAAPSPLRAGGAARIVARAETGRTFEELRYLAGKIAERGGAVALLGLRAADRGQVAFARSADVGVDVGALLREALGPLGGRGGGRPDAAQGGLPDPGRVEAAIEAARGRLLAD